MGIWLFIQLMRAVAKIVAKSYKASKAVPKGKVATEAAKTGIKTVDDLFAAGTKMKDVKAGGQISLKGNIDDVFNSLSKGGKINNLPNGRVQTRLPDGTTLTKYPAGSGSPTIQVNQGGKITKVRFE